MTEQVTPMSDDAIRDARPSKTARPWYRLGLALPAVLTSVASLGAFLAAPFVFYGRSEGPFSNDIWDTLVEVSVWTSIALAVVSGVVSLIGVITRQPLLGRVVCGVLTVVYGSMFLIVLLGFAVSLVP